MIAALHDVPLRTGRLSFLGIWFLDLIQSQETLETFYFVNGEACRDILRAHSLDTFD